MSNDSNGNSDLHNNDNADPNEDEGNFIEFLIYFPCLKQTKLITKISFAFTFAFTLTYQNYLHI